MTRQVTAAMVCEKFRQIAPGIIHKDVLTYTRPLFYKGKTLTIGVENSAWAHKIFATTEQLKQKLNFLLGGNVIEKIKTKPVTEDMGEQYGGFET